MISPSWCAEQQAGRSPAPNGEATQLGRGGRPRARAGGLAVTAPSSEMRLRRSVSRPALRAPKPRWAHRSDRRQQPRAWRETVRAGQSAWPSTPSCEIGAKNTLVWTLSGRPDGWRALEAKRPGNVWPRAACNVFSRCPDRDDSYILAAASEVSRVEWNGFYLRSPNARRPGPPVRGSVRADRGDESCSSSGLGKADDLGR